MHITRRLFLKLQAAAAISVGGSVLAACQAGSSSSPTSPPAAAAPTAAATPKPAIASVAPVNPPTAAPAIAASPFAVASPSAVAVASPAPQAAQGAVAFKQMYQQDAQHIGRTGYSGPRQPSITRRFDMGAQQYMQNATFPRADVQSSSAIGPDGTIYIATFAGTLFALRNSATASDQLEAVWTFSPPGGGSSLHGTPALSADGSIVYLGFSIGSLQAPPKASLFALSGPSSGTGGTPQVVWTADLGESRVMASPTVGPDGTVYLATGGGELYAVDVNGHTKWTAQTGPAIKSAVGLAADGTVYQPSSDGHLYAVSAQGQIKWSFDFGQHLGPTPLVTATPQAPTGAAGGANGIGSGASPTIGPDGTIYVGANNSNLYAITPDGQMKWLFEAERELAGIWTTPALSADGSTLYFGANKGGVYAVSTRDGSKKWQFPVYGSIYASSLLDARNVVYTGTTIEHVYAVDASSGEQLWDVDAGDAVWCAPSLRPDGSLVLANRSGMLLVLADA